jgi:3-methyladenine DNA glycosylase Mpg
VYLCYGLHMMLNVVADIEGVGAAVLIRSCSPVSGMHCSIALHHQTFHTAWIKSEFFICGFC